MIKAYQKGRKQISKKSRGEKNIWQELQLSM